ncbi:hypothetical protein [uncultured Alistipes sp.]|uniref:hypothetical protein n=1 Tax=uncultured Alistipes sp. TaxID=538949 RepID=UPI00272ABF74|nr:hypothetical protein [uncultured Alistipes sp.]
MYTSIEEAQTYTLELPRVSEAKKRIVGRIRQLLTAALGREFMEMPLYCKLNVCYLFVSLLLLFAWSEERIWLNVMNVLNFSNAVRMANNAVKKSSVRD